MKPKRKKQKTFYYIDIPNWPVGSNEGEWRNITTKRTRKEAEKFLLDTWGIQKEYAEIFLVPGKDI